MTTFSLYTPRHCKSLCFFFLIKSDNFIQLCKNSFSAVTINHIYVKLINRALGWVRPLAHLFFHLQHLYSIYICPELGPRQTVSFVLCVFVMFFDISTSPSSLDWSLHAEIRKETKSKPIFQDLDFWLKWFRTHQATFRKSKTL